MKEVKMELSSTLKKKLGGKGFYRWLGLSKEQIQKIEQEAKEKGLSFGQLISQWILEHLQPKFRLLNAYLSQDTLHFCLRLGILQYLLEAVEFIKICFPALQKLDLQLECELDTGEEWLEIEVTVQGKVDKVLADYKKYIDLWVSSTPWPECEKIRLVYNII